LWWVGGEKAFALHVCLCILLEPKKLSDLSSDPVMVMFHIP
jgi:hypothetical protein